MNTIMYGFETIFDISYLLLVFALGFIIIKKSTNMQQKLFGYMAIILGFGDSFHLVPRVYSMWSAGGFEANSSALGLGQFVASITMTFFYIILYYIWKKRYNIKETKALDIALIGLAVIRIALCLFPQNNWLSPDAPISWGIYRNIPFLIMGIIIIVIFFKKAKENNDKIFKNMWLAIFLSFGFYIPVVLFAKTFPPVGSLMMPKTLAYVWIVYMGFKDIKIQKK